MMKATTLFRLLSFAPLVGASLVGTVTLAQAAPSASTTQANPTARQVADTTGSTAKDAPGADAAQARNAARSRMRECGHQWSSMKKNGAAGAMTWKDFSQGCLAKQ